MLLPGPEAQQLATYIGWLMHGVRGGIAAGALFVLPSLVILIALSWLYLTYSHVPAVAGVLYAAYRSGSRALRNTALRVVAALAFLSIFAFDVPFPYIVLAAAFAGWAGARIAPGYFQADAGHASAAAGYGPALIDDHTPIPLHARFRWRR